MPEQTYEDLFPVFESLTITSPTSFFFAGEPHVVNPTPVTSMPGYPSHPLPPNPLVRDIQGFLYAKAYAQRIGDTERPPGDLNATLASPAPYDLGSQLIAANNTQMRWDPGWTIYNVGPNGLIYVQKGERQKTAVPGEFMTTGPPGVPPAVGAVVQLLVQREALNMQPGMYFAFGDAPSDVWDEFALLRFYFHSTAEGSPALFRFLTTRLNEFRIPFRMKGHVNPLGYVRTDAVVLYFAKRYYEIVARIVRDMPDDVAAGLRKTVPLFTKTVRPGVGLAEEPNTGESFGMHRCRLTAEGVVEAWGRGAQDKEAWSDAVAARFTVNRLRLDKPYLNPDSVDLFEIPSA